MFNIELHDTYPEGFNIQPYETDPLYSTRNRGYFDDIHPVHPPYLDPRDAFKQEERFGDRVVIRSDGTSTGTRLEINGVPIQNATSISWSVNIDNLLSTLQLELRGPIEIELQSLHTELRDCTSQPNSAYDYACEQVGRDVHRDHQQRSRMPNEEQHFLFTADRVGVPDTEPDSHPDTETATEPASE